MKVKQEIWTESTRERSSLMSFTFFQPGKQSETGTAGSVMTSAYLSLTSEKSAFTLSVFVFR